MKDTHLHLAMGCKGVANMAKTIQDQAQKISLLEKKNWHAYKIAPLSGKYPTFHTFMATAKSN